MTNLKHYVSAVATYNTMTDIDKPGVVIALYGPRGSTICLAEFSLDEAYNLRKQLGEAVSELEFKLTKPQTETKE